MQEFKRARSEEQKCQRMADIKQATAELFADNPYHDITLTTIAERLGWSRANLYKYVATKEEIFLELSADARDEYFEALAKAFPANKPLDARAAAKKWAKVATEHQDWPLYGTILMTIIEVNVTVDRLKVFKKGYYDQLPELSERFGAVLGITPESFPDLLNTIYYHQTGIVGNCANNPLIAEAIAELGIDRSVPDFKTDMEWFIEMCIERWQKNFSK